MRKASFPVKEKRRTTQSSRNGEVRLKASLLFVSQNVRKLLRAPGSISLKLAWQAEQEQKEQATSERLVRE